MQEYNENTVKSIINFFRNRGLNDYAISGILGNWYIESLFCPNNAQNSYMNKFGITDEQYTTQVDNGVWKRPDNGNPFSCDSIGYGLMQLTSAGRKGGFYEYVKKKGVSVANLLAQLEWCWIELTSSGYKVCFNALANATSAGDAAIAFMKYYEKPASKDNPSAQKNRANVAEEFYDKYFGGSTVMPKVLAISAGHYLYTAGKRCLKSIDPTETREWVLNSRIADKLAVILNRYEGIKIVRLDDPTGQKEISLANRAKTSDNVKADLYLAIHHNAGINGKSGGGTTVFYYPKASNKVEAEKIYNLLIKHTGLTGRSTPVRSTTSLYEVRVPKARSILVENGFMDSTHDTPIILTEAHADKTAQALAEYFITTWNLKLKDEGKSDILAEIESVKANINALEQRLKELEAML